MPQKQLIAIGLGLRTGVLKVCPEHCRIYCDDEVDPGLAYALAAQLVHRQNAYVAPFAGYAELAELLEDTVNSAPKHCPTCGGCEMPASSAGGYEIPRRRVLETG